MSYQIKRSSSCNKTYSAIFKVMTRMMTSQRSYHKSKAPMRLNKPTTGSSHSTYSSLLMTTHLRESGSSTTSRPWMQSTLSGWNHISNTTRPRWSVFLLKYLSRMRLSSSRCTLLKAFTIRNTSNTCFATKLNSSNNRSLRLMAKLRPPHSSPNPAPNRPKHPKIALWKSTQNSQKFNKLNLPQSP